MRTPSTITRLARRRIRNWISKFCACCFRLEEEEEDASTSLPEASTEAMSEVPNGSCKPNKRVLTEEEDACASLPQASTEAMFAVTTGSCKPNKVSKDNRFNQGRRDSRSVDSKETDDDNEDSRLAEEDFIVFCFREDGTFEVMKDEKSGASDHLNCVTRASKSSSRPVNNRKFIWGENGERDSSDEIYQTYDGEEGEEEEESIHRVPVSPDEIQGVDEIEENEHGGTVHVESIYLNQSDGSSGSFAFPVLRGEGIGSPVPMPRYEGIGSTVGVVIAFDGDGRERWSCYSIVKACSFFSGGLVRRRRH